jgi:predicted nucleic acid-binding protein
MADLVLADTGPLVAFLDRNDPYHLWACERIREFTGPLLTCEAVLSECAHLTERADPGNQQLMTLLRLGGLRLTYSLRPDLEAVATQMAKYRDVPMSLADACLVRMSELHDRARVFTLDSDFKRYRRHGRQAIPLIIPGPTR